MDAVTIVIVVCSCVGTAALVHFGVKAGLKLFRMNRKRRVPLRHYEPPFEPEEEEEERVNFDAHESSYGTKKKKKKKKVYKSKNELMPGKTGEYAYMIQ